MSDTVVQKFSGYYQNFINYILQDKAVQDMSPFDKIQLKEMLDYNLPHGYRRIPYFMLSAYHAIEKPENISDEKQDLVNLMGWIIHLTQVSYQILDDIADGTVTRSQRPCWHQRPAIGLHAVIDGLFLAAVIPNLLTRHFFAHKHYHDMIELFYQTTMMSCVGERIQLSQCHWHDMTVGRWTKIAHNKTSWYQCVTPFKTALFLTETYEADKFEIMKPILLDFGVLLQMINDFLDAFPKEGSPVGDSTDIQDGRCSWLLVNALKICNPSQKQMIEDNYGRKDEVSIKKVMDVYKELGLEQYGYVFKDQLYNDLMKRIDGLPEDFPKQALREGLMIGYHGY